MRQPGDDDYVLEPDDVLDDDDEVLVPLGEVLQQIQTEREAVRGTRWNRLEELVAAGQRDRRARR